jgi:hypothetical protein
VDFAALSEGFHICVPIAFFGCLGYVYKTIGRFVKGEFERCGRKRSNVKFS